MQKKAKLRLTESLFVLLCLACSAFSVSQFWTALNKSLFKLNEEPIATISFKYKTAQRRFLDDLLWDRLRQESPVYEGDTIRTAPLSEATIYFKDGNIMDLQENTMARISLKEDGVEVDFDSGSFTVQSATGSSFKIKNKDSVVLVGSESELTAQNYENGNLNVQLSNGSAVLNGTNGKSSKLEQGARMEFNSDGSQRKLHLSVTYPLNNQKFLNVNTTNYSIPFSWKTESSEVLIETSRSKDFEQVENSMSVKDAYGANVELGSGVHYWRISSTADDGVTETVSGKLSIYYSPSPELISPKANYKAVYRNKKPQIRFAWTESERATSYEITIADNAQMENPVVVKRSPQPSCIVSTLPAGTWYWRVAPYYRMNNLGLGVPSKVSSFVIEQSAELLPANLLLPAEGALVSTRVPMANGTTAYQKINFSWQADQEAANYDFSLWSENSHGVPTVITHTENNYVTVDCSAVDVANGKWYWQVVKNDGEGNEVKSEIREFYAIDADLEQRTLFPPDNYRLAQTRSQDIRFSWKTNIPYVILFQVARDPSFNEIVFQEKTTGSTVNGRSLQTGNYYWRIKTQVAETELATPAKSFVVEPPLEAPEITYPANGSRAVIRPNTPLEFKWAAVEGADYYQIKIAKTSNPDKVLYDQSFIESADGKVVTHKIDMENWDEVNYTWTVQAFREETVLASRANGYMSESSFQMKKLKPVTLVLPNNNVTIDGATAIKKPGYFSWTSIEQTRDSKLVLYKDNISEDSIVQEWNNPPNSVKMPALYEGTYYWTVQAMTLDDLDISALETRKITITEIPKLPAPNLNSPTSKNVFNKDYFKSNRSIKFSWQSVSGADRYVLRIKRKNGSEIFSVELDSKKTEYELKDLTKLEKGKLIWSVEAQNFWYDEEEKKNVVFQHGKEKEETLNIDLPSIKQPKVEETGIMYGR